MNRTDYEASTAWSTLDGLADILRGDLQPSSEEDREAIRRLQALVEHVDAYRACEPTLVELSGPNELSQHLTTIHNSLNQYSNDRDANRAHLVAAANVVPNVMNTLRASFPPPGADAATQAMKAAATRFKNGLDAQVTALQDLVDDLRVQLAAEQEARQQAGADAEARLGEFKVNIDEQETRSGALNDTLDQQIASQEASFDSEVASRQEAFTKREKARDTKQEERLTQVEATAAEARESETKRAQAVLGQLREYETQAKDVIDSTSRHAVSGQYGTWAAHQSRAALCWTVAAVLIGLGVVGGLIWAMSSAADDSAQFVAYKISAGLLAAAVAGYAARQASEHRVQERRFKRLALDVAALEPFLATLEDSTGIRDEFAKRVFAPEETQSEDGSTTRAGGVEFSTSQILDLLKGLGR